MLRKLSTHLYNKIVGQHVIGSLFISSNKPVIVKNKTKFISEEEIRLLWYLAKQRNCLNEKEENYLHKCKISAYTDM